MEANELKELLATDEGKEIVKSMAVEMGFEPKESIEGLKSKNRELLGKLKSNKEVVSKYHDILGDDLDDEKIEAIKSVIQDPKIVQSKDENAKYQRELADYKKKFELESEAKNKYAQKYNQRLIEAELSKIFSQNNIDPIHFDILTGALGSKLKIESDDSGKDSIIYDDGAYGKPFTEFFNEFMLDKGQAYIKQVVNKGTGSQSFNKNNSTVFTKESITDPKIRAEYWERLKKGEKIELS